MPPVREISQYCKKACQKLGNRRRYERLPVEGTLVASWKNLNDEVITHRCHCVNLSQRGIAIVSDAPAPLSADTYVHYSQHGVKSFATVRYCRQRGGKYQIGLNFRAEPATWE